MTNRFGSGPFRVAMWQLMIPTTAVFLCMIFKIEKTTKIRNIAMLIGLPFPVGRALFRIVTDIHDYGEDPNYNMPFAFLFIMVISAAMANIFNKKFLTGTKVNLVQFAFFAYIFAMCGTFCIFTGENIYRWGTYMYWPFTVWGWFNAEEVSSVALFFQLNEVVNYVLLLYLARKTYIARASVFGIVSSSYVIFEGIFAERFGIARWYWIAGTFTDLGCMVIAYALIFFERIKNKNIAKF